MVYGCTKGSMGGWNGTEKAAPYLRDGLGFWERQQDALGREPFSDKVKKKKKKMPLKCHTGLYYLGSQENSIRLGI